MDAASRSLLASAAFLAILIAFTEEGRAELRYAPKAGTSHAYSVEIVAELPDATETLKGIIVYTVKEQTDEQIKLEYRGGLTKARKTKAAAGGPRGPRRPPGRPGPGMHNPFATLTFKGLMQTTNQLTLTPEGDVLAMEGSSQLPYLLGNLSMLVFEPFPENQEAAWEVQNGIAITETNERQTLPRRGGPRRPGALPPKEEGKRTAGVEISKYKITGAENDRVTVEKTYSLESPLVDGKGFALSGEGTWVFDQTKSVPQKLDYQQTLTVQLDSVSVKVPMTIKYEMLTEEQLAEHRIAQEKRQEEMKAQLAEAQEKAKARRSTPFTAEQKAEVLKQLASTNMGDVRRGLNALQFKDPQEPDAEITAALKELANHKNPGIRRQAEQVGKKWAMPQSE